MMKKIYLFALLSLTVITAIQAQERYRGCLAGELSEQQYRLHPERLIANALLDSFTREYVRRGYGHGAQRSAPYVIPVVFHIIHDAGSENLPDSLIYVEMEHWNEYTNMRNADLAHTAPAFDTLIGNDEVTFRLAQIDPDGHCTNGIERIYSSSTYDGGDHAKQHPWPREKYLNIWVVSQMSAANSGALAYAYYPGSVATYVNNDIIDGIIVMSVGVGREDDYDRPVIAHESGHWMNLAHTWGGTNDPGVDCSGDDGVDDTPPTKGSYGVCNPNRSECNPTIHDHLGHDSIIGIIENEQNIMNYSTCHFMYTKGQVLRMHAALESPISGRANLWSPSNLLATGTDQPLSYPNPNSCAIPVADFAANKRFACSGDPVRFTDVSWNAEVQSRTWTFPADVDMGTSTTSDVSPTVRFNTSGWQEVSLQVTNTNGSNTMVKSMVYISDGSPIAAPYFEGFENANEVQANWQPINYDNNNTAFQRFTAAGHYSNSSAKLNLYNAQLDGDKDEYVSPLLDLSTVDPSQMTLSFDYSFATYDANHMSDSIASLAVYVSNNCGTTWTRIYFNPGGFNLYNAGAYTSGPYTPGQQDEFWQNVTTNIPAGYQGFVNFKFSVLSARGANHFYLDNINVGQSVAGISHVSSPVSSMVIAPNPTQGSATLSVMMNTNTDATIKMTDMTGRDVMTLYNGLLPAGQKNISFDTQNISSGIYTIRISDGKTSVQKRFVKL